MQVCGLGAVSCPLGRYSGECDIDNGIFGMGESGASGDEPSGRGPAGGARWVFWELDVVS